MAGNAAPARSRGRQLRLPVLPAVWSVRLVLMHGGAAPLPFLALDCTFPVPGGFIDPRHRRCGSTRSSHRGRAPPHTWPIAQARQPIAAEIPDAAFEILR